MRMEAMAGQDKKSVPRQRMAEQDPKERARNFDEVPFGFTGEQARLEASRCLQCKKPLCVDGCPVRVPIPQFLKLIAEGKFTEAARKIKEQNALPAICGRVCPQEDQCEKTCVLKRKGEAVSIGCLERFAADFERNSGAVEVPEKRPATGKKAAVIGSGPAGLATAGDLVKLGHEVTVFEALHEAGGVLVYGIPEFRLPKGIVKAEVDYLKQLGVRFEMNMIVGKTVSVEELFGEGYDAVFVGAGAGLPRFLGVPGENLIGVYSANEYLTRSNLMKAYKFPEYDTPIIRAGRVAVVGGGNVAMDSARTALRLGAEKCLLIYRRSREEMPARIDEIHHAEEEGVEFHLLAAPLEVLGDDKGRVRGLRCQKMELGEPDASGRRRPVPVAGSEFEIEVDVVIPALGNAPNPLIPGTTPDIKVHRWGGIVAEDPTGKTSMDHVYAGGDIVSGAATVILAMGAGRNAAAAIHRELTGEDLS